ncbi:MAG: ABC transporter substrate-binding protein [Oscillospiraceae bacterium]|nr:ABC transporter substrate-binding protein [Oscillospiraceae bacterium]
MKKLFCAVLCALVLLSVSLPAAALDVSADYDWTRFKGDNVTLYVYNWGEYISDGSDDSVDVIGEFEKLTGITVNYTTFASNEEMYAKIKSGGAQYDVILPSDYMIARMINENMLEKLDFSNIPNFGLVDDTYKNMEYDPDDAYSVPYMWGLVGLIYNTTMVDDDITSWDALWDQRYMGNILMFSNSRDAFGIALLKLGYSLNTTDPKELEEAANELKSQKMLVQAYVMDEIFNKMEGGEAAVAPYYAGDALTMMEENPDLAFVYPEEGTNYFVDAMVIPAGSKSKEAAEMFINFMCEPEVSAANAGYIGYSTPISEAKDLLDLDPEAEAIAYPDASVMEKTEVFKLLPDETNAQMDRYWTEILSYNENPNLWIGPVFLAAALAASVVILIVRARKKNRSIY